MISFCKQTTWDLVHIDIQGHEVDVCQSGPRELTARARWLVIGTHSRKIDGDLIEMFWKAGWALEHEKPSRFAFRAESPTLEGMTGGDGKQVWWNAHLEALA